MCLLSFSFALFCEKCMKKYFVTQYVDLFCSVFNKIISHASTPYIQKVGGVTSPLIFHQRQTIFSLYHVNHHKINWFLLARHSNYFVCFWFRLK